MMLCWCSPAAYQMGWCTNNEWNTYSWTPQMDSLFRTLMLLSSNKHEWEMMFVCRFDHIIHLCISPPNLWRHPPTELLQTQNKLGKQGIEWWMLLISFLNRVMVVQMTIRNHFPGDKGKGILHCLFYSFAIVVVKETILEEPSDEPTNNKNHDHCSKRTDKTHRLFPRNTRLDMRLGQPLCNMDANQRTCKWRMEVDKIAQRTPDSQQRKKQHLNQYGDGNNQSTGLYHFSSSAGLFQYIKVLK